MQNGPECFVGCLPGMGAMRLMKVVGMLALRQLPIQAKPSRSRATSGFRLEWINIPTTIPCPYHNTGLWNEVPNRVWQKEEPLMENLHSRV